MKCRGRRVKGKKKIDNTISFRTRSSLIRGRWCTRCGRYLKKRENDLARQNGEGAKVDTHAGCILFGVRLLLLV